MFLPAGMANDFASKVGTEGIDADAGSAECVEEQVDVPIVSSVPSG